MVKVFKRVNFWSWQVWCFNLFFNLFSVNWYYLTEFLVNCILVWNTKILEFSTIQARLGFLLFYDGIISYFSKIEVLSWWWYSGRKRWSVHWNNMKKQSIIWTLNHGIHSLKALLTLPDSSWPFPIIPDPHWSLQTFTSWWLSWPNITLLCHFLTYEKL